MFGLPPSTEVKKQLPKKTIYAKFDLKPSQRESFDADIVRIDIVGFVSTKTVPALAVGEEVKQFYMFAVELKRKEYDAKNIALLTKLIQQKIVFALQFEEETQFAIYHTKLISSAWDNTEDAKLTLSGLNLDTAWDNIVKSIGHIDVEEGNTLKEQILTLCEKQGISDSEIRTVAVVGNTCMHHMLMAIDPRPLVTPPYSPGEKRALQVEAMELLGICPNATVRVFPNIAGFVGADTVGCLVAQDFGELEELSLLLDIGTNGELVIGNRDWIIAGAGAAGPALEGAKITFGMRGAPGAIDKVWLENGEVRFHVIGDTEPSGICGSGLIDAVASFLDLGLINKRGRIQSTEETNGQRVLYLNNDIYLTQNDIHEVMLAKGAIAAGVELLAKTLGIEVSDIDRVLLAGAFGSFLNADNACRIGLLPAGLEGKATAVGNAAARRVHFMLPVSFFMVIRVVEQGQCISEKRMKHIAVADVQPFAMRISESSTIYFFNNFEKFFSSSL